MTRSEGPSILHGKIILRNINTLDDLLLLALQHTVGFSFLNYFLPLYPFFTLLSSSSYSHYVHINSIRWCILLQRFSPPFFQKCAHSSFQIALPYLCPYCIVQFVSMRAVRLLLLSFSEQFSFPGQSRQPCAQRPTWRTRLSLLVWSLN